MKSSFLFFLFLTSPTMSRAYHHGEKSYNYGQYYQSSLDASKRWTPIDIRQVNFQDPPNPEDYMYGPQYRNCFEYKRKRSWLGRIIALLLCVE